jgi:hypothetical protein
MDDRRLKPSSGFAEGFSMKRWVIAFVIAVSLAAVGTVTVMTLRQSRPPPPKSVAERIAEACGPYGGQDAWIQSDGSVCCDLCGA